MGTYIRLTDYNSASEKEKEFFNLENYFLASEKKYEVIPSIPYAYWVPDQMQYIYNNNSTLNEIADVKHGMSTGKNELFLRLWYEVDWNKIDVNIKEREDIALSTGKFFPYNKGGSFRKWYGNIDYVVWYDLQGQRMMASMSGHRHDGKDRYFQEGITWSFISSGYFGVRYTPTGFVFDVAGSSMFMDGHLIKYIVGLLCSHLGTYFMGVQNPTMNFQVGDLKKVPVIQQNIEGITTLVDHCIDFSKEEWDEFETSWDFKKHPLI